MGGQVEGDMKDVIFRNFVSRVDSAEVQHCLCLGCSCILIIIILIMYHKDNNKL